MKTIFIAKNTLFALLLLHGSLSFAYHFEQGGIYYNITGENTVEVAAGVAPEAAPASMGSYSDSIVIPSSVAYEGATYQVTAIGDSAFLFCLNLKSVAIPNTVERIGNSAFFFCSSYLYSITLPEGLKHVGNEAFFYCMNLRSLTLPPSVQHIGSNAFANCMSLKEVVASWENPSAVNYGAAIFNAVPLEACTLKIPYRSQPLYAQTPTWSIFPNMVEHHPDFVVNNEGTLTKYVGAGGDIAIPYGVKSIDRSVFKDNATITAVVIPGSVKSIGESAFESCTALASVTIPESVSSIENFVFINCTGLQEFNLSWQDPRAVANGGSIAYGGALFTFAPTSCTINIPPGTSDAYTIYPWVFFDQFRVKIPTIQELDAQGFVWETDGHDYYRVGLYGQELDGRIDTVARRIDLRTGGYYYTYVSKIALKRGEILHVGNDFYGKGYPTVKIYDEQGNEQAAEKRPANFRENFGFKAKAEGTYYVQLAGTFYVEKMMYSFAISKIGLLQSVRFAYTSPSIKDPELWRHGFTHSDVVSDLPGVYGTDSYGTEKYMSGSWTWDNKSGIAIYHSPYPYREFPNIKYTYGGCLDSIFIYAAPSIGALGTLTLDTAATHSSLAVNTVPLPDRHTARHTAEYAVSEADTLPAEGWQAAPSFTNLKAGTLYYVFARIVKDGVHLIATSHPLTAVTTCKTDTVIQIQEKHDTIRDTVTQIEIKYDTIAQIQIKHDTIEVKADTVIVKDTVELPKIVYVYDTTEVEVAVKDTVYDTVKTEKMVYLHDTTEVEVYVHDTVEVEKIVYRHDTTEVEVEKPVYVHDTVEVETIVYIYDTIYPNNPKPTHAGGTAAQPAVKVYPNPVINGELTVDNGQLEIGVVKVIDSSGAVVRTQDFGRQTTGTLLLHGLQGAYFVRVGKATYSIVVR